MNLGLLAKSCQINLCSFWKIDEKLNPTMPILPSIPLLCPIIRICPSFVAGIHKINEVYNRDGISVIGYIG